MHTGSAANADEHHSAERASTPAPDKMFLVFNEKPLADTKITVKRTSCYLAGCFELVLLLCHYGNEPIPMSSLLLIDSRWLTAARLINKQAELTELL